MPPVPGETILNQMKRSTGGQQTVTVGAAGGILVPYSEDRVSLILPSLAVNSYTVSRFNGDVSGNGVLIPPNTSAVTLTISTHGSLVKGPLYVSAGTFPATITYMEALNTAP